MTIIPNNMLEILKNLQKKNFGDRFFFFVNFLLLYIYFRLLINVYIRFKLYSMIFIYLLICFIYLWDFYLFEKMFFFFVNLKYVIVKIGQDVANYAQLQLSSAIATSNGGQFQYSAESIIQ